MEYALNCDTCDYRETVGDENRAYSMARDHERERGSHFVVIETLG